MTVQNSRPPVGQSEYHRPNQKWVCSAIDACQSCIGPNGQGNCPLNECVPQLSLRTKRTRFTIAVTCFTIGLLVIIFASSRRNELIVPGELCSNHAHLFEDSGSNRCGACHDQAEATLGQWIHSAFTGSHAVGPTQSQLCLNCHGDEFNHEQAQGIHNVSIETLTALGSKYEIDRFDVRNVVAAPNANGHSVACSTCHKEHRGKDHNLTMLTNQQCQSCHSRYYHSFERDHPEFTQWPFASERSILFDHANHMAKHFPAKGKLMNCRDCHVSDSTGKIQQVRPFEQSCAQCHDKQIDAALGDRHKLLALPMLDLEVLREENISIGQWPETANGDFDGPIPPLMQILLLADKQARPVLQRLPTDFQFADIDPSDKSQLQDAATLAWAIKRLLYDLATDSESSLHQRLNEVTGQQIDSAIIQDISSHMHSALFREAQRYWMPRLAMEMQLNDAGQPAQTIAVPIGPHSVMSNIEVQQDEILAPNPLSKKSEYSKSGSSSGDSNSGLPTVNNQDGGSSRFPNQMVRSKQNRPGQRQLDGNSDSRDEDILAENPLKKWLTDPNTQINIKKIPGTKPQVDGNSGQANAGHDQRVELPSNQYQLNSDQLSAIAAAMRQLADAGHSRWIRNDLSLSIDYVPDGHADRVIKAWYEIAVLSKQNNEFNKTKLVNQISNLNSRWGTCSTCHSIERSSQSIDSQQSNPVHWQATYRDPNIRSWTNFSHGPHIIQPQSNDCQSCHVVRSGDEQEISGSRITPVSTAHANSPGDFHPIRKQNCSSCHHKEGASNSCTTCHSYHIGSHIRSRLK